MPYREITDRSAWDKFVVQSPNGSFSQSFDLGEFQKALGRRVCRFTYEENGSIIGQAQVIVHTLPLGFTYIYLPYGPVISEKAFAQWDAVAEKIIIHTKELFPHAIFALIEPKLDLSHEAAITSLGTHLKLQPIGSVQPQDTSIIDLSKSEEELLTTMHQKTRYNIRLAEKKGVRIVTGKKYLADFLRLHHETSARDQFVTHEKSHFEKLIGSLPDDMCRVYAAKNNEKIIAANIVIRFGNTTTYLHGASASVDREVMAPYLLQWQQIKDAKRDGFARYDFWGIAPRMRKSNKEKSWAGITRFKNGFGGSEVSYVGATVLPIRRFWYSVYRKAKHLR